jgi:hypothetical protein
LVRVLKGHHQEILVAVPDVIDVRHAGGSIAANAANSSWCGVMIMTCGPTW